MTNPKIPTSFSDLEKTGVSAEFKVAARIPFLAVSPEVFHRQGISWSPFERGWALVSDLQIEAHGGDYQVGLDLFPGLPFNRVLALDHAEKPEDLRSRWARFPLKAFPE